MRQNGKRRPMYVWAFFIFFCALFAFAAEVHANGEVSADAPVPPAEKRTVRKAPIKRPAKKTAKSAKRVAPQEAMVALPPQPTSLETGMALLEQERYTPARRWLQKAVQEDCFNPWAWYLYGVVHERTGEFQQAQFFYTKALELDPTLPPLSRVVAWPDNGERKALWDPLRPARVYPIPTNDHGVAIIPPDAPQATRRPARPPIDPELPKVPVYVPPEPTNSIVPGDAPQPPVYVPPPEAPRVLEYAPQGSPPLRLPPTQISSPATDPGGPVYMPPAPPENSAPPGAVPTDSAPVYMPPNPPGAQGQ
ncbi:MAG: tetratricopeptide repeat protein [Synergistaceae bacterium]|nr:tetratricopeptide repeat protein [Synergistaceae bacterium]